jgi:putative toxin-antitoxin system antitoxin component (TIGR02293 family)
MLSKHLLVLEPEARYEALHNTPFDLIHQARAGIPYRRFHDFAASSPFTQSQWAMFLHLSERTLQRYEKENRAFDIPQAERILAIALLYKKGVFVFSNKEAFNTWLQLDNLALGRVKPLSLLDSSFGISLLHDELGKIENGIPA